VCFVLEIAFSALDSNDKFFASRVWKVTETLCILGQEVPTHENVAIDRIYDMIVEYFLRGPNFYEFLGV